MSDSAKPDFRLPLDHVGTNLTDIFRPELVVNMALVLDNVVNNDAQDTALLEERLAVSSVEIAVRGARHGDLQSTLGTLVARLDIMVTVGVEFPEVRKHSPPLIHLHSSGFLQVNPYCNVAWKMLAAVYEVMCCQMIVCIISPNLVDQDDKKY